MKMVVILLSMLFLFSCQEKSVAEETQKDDSSAIAKDAAKMEESSADCDDDEDKIMDAANAESDDIFSANTGCSIEE